MRTHIAVVAWINIVFNGLWLLGAAAFLTIMLFAGGLSAAGGGGFAALGIFGAIAALGVVIFSVLALPGFIVGIGLLNLAPWARIGGVILAALGLFNFPFGTLVSAYTLFVLLNSESAAMFDHQRHYA